MSQKNNNANLILKYMKIPMKKQGLQEDGLNLSAQNEEKQQNKNLKENEILDTDELRESFYNKDNNNLKTYNISANIPNKDLNHLNQNNNNENPNSLIEKYTKFNNSVNNKHYNFQPLNNKRTITNINTNKSLI